MQLTHHLQLDFVKKLAESPKPVSYSELKRPDIENSLFSYHLNKLLSNGLVQKEGDGYSLTVEGSRWLNDNGFSLQTEEKLRVYIAR